MERHPPSTGHGDTRLAGLAAIRQAATDTHVLDYLAAAYRHRYLAAGVFLVVILFAVARNYMTTPMYRAQAKLIIELEDDQVGSTSPVPSPVTSTRIPALLPDPVPHPEGP